MSFLLHISFSNSSRLDRDEYCFEYKGTQFKLIQNDPQQYSDVLLTIIPDNSDNNKKEVYTIASEFLAALSFENMAMIHLGGDGGMGVNNQFQLSQAKCRVFDLPTIPFAGHTGGFDIDEIPKVETQVQRTALILFREAMASNNIYLSFLFYWQVLDTARGNSCKFVNDKRDEIRIEESDINQLSLGNKSLGKYLKEDCRHAVAHIKRKPGIKVLELDNINEIRRMAISTRIVKSFAEFYIREKLQLINKLHLIRYENPEFPKYVDQDYFRTHYVEG